MATTITPLTITFGESARQAYGEARALIQTASRWAHEVQPDFGDISTEADKGVIEQLTKAAYKAAEAEATERLGRVAAMERSLLNGLVYLFTTGGEHDGPLTISRDGEACFFWIYEKSRYHGGLVFHADYGLAGIERLPVGEWSIHT